MCGESETPSTQHRRLSPASHARRAGEGERKFIFNLVTTPASGRGVITESSAKKVLYRHLSSHHTLRNLT